MHKQRWLDAAKAAGIEQLEIYEQKSRSTSIRLFEGSVDGYTISECNGFAIRGIYKGNMGICFLEQDDDALLEDTLCRIKENAEVITSRDEVEIYAGDSAYPQLQLRSCTWNAHPDAEKIEMLKTVEQYIKESDARIAQVMNTSYGEVDVEIAMMHIMRRISVQQLWRRIKRIQRLQVTGSICMMMFASTRKNLQQV